MSDRDNRKEEQDEKNWKPVTDIQECVEKTVSRHMKPFFDANFHEHERTHSKMKEMEDLIIKLAARKELNFIWVAITFLAFLVIFGLNTCSLTK